MADGLYIGVDLGTTGVKVGLFDGGGLAVSSAAREFELDTPAPGFAEFDAEEYVALAFDGIREAAAGAGHGGGAVRAIGLSSQAQTFVLVGTDGQTKASKSLAVWAPSSSSSSNAARRVPTALPRHPVRQGVTTLAPLLLAKRLRPR